MAKLKRGVRSTLNQLHDKLTLIGGPKAKSCLETLSVLEGLLSRELSPAEERVLKTYRSHPHESNYGIARHLGISEKTVKAHNTEIFKKLGVASRGELLLFIRESTW